MNQALVWQDLPKRTISATVLGIAVLFITWWDPVSFDILLLLGAFLLLCEWMVLTRTRHTLFIPIGVFYIGFACYSLALIRHIYGWEATFLLFALVWVGDIAAYLVGKRFGKRKLTPTLSPGKTWEGLIASIVATATLSVWAFSINLHFETVFDSILIGVMFALVGLAGDLFESSLKRKAGVKNSGDLIPGHGGLFDRVDALLPCTILAALILFY